MPRLFELTEDNNPNTANRISFGRAGVAALNMTFVNFLTWLEANLTFPTLTTIQTIVNIGDWNMNVSAAGDLQINVAHTITDYKKIRSVEVIVWNDLDTTFRYPLTTPGTTGTTPQGAVVSITATNIALRILTSGFFDGATFDSTSYNRGYILIEAIP